MTPLMLRTRRLLSLLTSVAICLLALSGCGGKKPVTVKGKLVLPSTMKLAETDIVQISFVPQEEKGLAGSAKPSLTDLSFVVKDTNGKGVVPGKYKVTVKFDAYAGMKDGQKRADAMKPINDSYGLLKSKLTYEVTLDEEQNITVDLIKGTVTKN